MSSGGGDRGKMFFCHVCNLAFTCSDDSEPNCPICHDGFVEEYDPNPDPNISFRLRPLNPVPLLPILSSPASTTPITRPESHMFDPLHFLRNHIQGLQADGSNIQFQIYHPSETEFILPANLGDYFLGPGFEQLIQQLAENHPSRRGTLPASKDAVEKLPTLTVDAQMLKSEMNVCPVCQEDFEKGSQIKQMTCKHVFHDECLLPWLKMHSTCPVCRYELPTDNDGSGGGGNSPVQGTLRLSLRYPFGEDDSAQNTRERESGNRQEGLD